MLKDIDRFYLNQEEPVRSCFMALRTIILETDKDVTATMKYGMPFFCYKGKMFCYLWKDKTTKEPYLGMVEGNRLDHPLLEQGNRSRMKIFRINPNEDLPIEAINLILNQALDLYKRGVVKVKGK